MSDDPVDPQAVFRHVDDEEWVEVKRQRNADGSTSSVWEKWLAYSSAPQYLTLYARYDPGMIVRRHGHHSPHVVFVLEGEIWCEDRQCLPGTHMELPHGAAFGPFRAGPDGVVMYEVMMGDPRSWGVDRERVGAFAEEHGVEPLPDPEITLPGWLEDLRSSWQDDDASEELEQGS